MEYKPPRRTVRNGPEAEGASGLVKVMRRHGWSIWKLGGSKYSAGWPDYYAFHKVHGHRWVETKSNSGRLTPSQLERFSEMAAAGDKIIVARNEKDYEMILRNTDNWRFYA